MISRNSDNDSELVIGIVSTVGTNSSEMKTCIIDSLSRFNYKSHIIKVSEHILSRFVVNLPDFSNREYERISFFMDKGNEIREKTQDAAILMKGVSAFIFDNYRKNNEGPQPRKAYIIDSIKHPDEVEFLRNTYGEGFHLIGISDTYERRKKYLVERKGMSEENALTLLNRDNNEKEKNGQHTGDVYQQADYFISASDNSTEMQAHIFRLLDLLFGNPFITPTFEEYAMFRAYVASLRSADLSRQIGVVITKDNEILAEGVNDCPKAFGGLYWPIYNEKDSQYIDEKDGRDYMFNGGYDSNKIQQQKIITNILNELNCSDTEENIIKIKSTGIGALTEFGRVVHGEMEALMMCARNGISTRECSMYMTTFPCHNCAKHIIAAGIKKVVYIEPYPKSKALEFYTNEISQDVQDSGKKVIFISFKGVGPHRFIDLFSMHSIRWYSRKRKNKDGYVIQWKRDKANLRNPMSLMNYIEMEQSAYKQYTEEINQIREENENEQNGINTIE